MKFLFLSVLISLSVLSLLTSARFVPNISSSLPPLVSNANISAWDTFHKFSGCQHGDKLHGLSKLKQYLNYFGYIPNSPYNFTDDFDDSLELALKTYQRNFNLNPTGKLDQQTLNQIVRPRCGNADIVNGSTSMNSGKHNTSHFRTVAHYSFFPGRPRWPANKYDLTYSFLPGNQLPDTFKSVFSRAFGRWSTVTPLTFTESSDFYSSDIRIGFFSGDHGDGEPFDGVLGTLAHAFSPPSGRFHLDLDENWVGTGDVTTSSLASAIDLESVAVHEIGHLLGLGHSSVEESIMFPTISSRTRKVELAADDIQGIELLYGGNPNYNGTLSTPSAQERDTNNSSLGHILGPFIPTWSLMGFILFLIF